MLLCDMFQWVEANGGASKVGPLLVRRLRTWRDGDEEKLEQWAKPTVEPPIVRCLASYSESTYVSGHCLFFMTSFVPFSMTVLDTANC